MKPCLKRNKKLLAICSMGRAVFLGPITELEEEVEEEKKKELGRGRRRAFFMKSIRSES